MKSRTRRALAIVLVVLASTFAVSAAPIDPKLAARDVVNDLAAERFEHIRESFSEDMRANLSTEQMAQVWHGVVAQLGAYKGQDDPEAHKVDDVDVILIRCRFEHAAAQVEVDYNAGGKIVGLWIRPTQ